MVVMLVLVLITQIVMGLKMQKSLIIILLNQLFKIKMDMWMPVFLELLKTPHLQHMQEMWERIITPIWDMCNA